jgi:hypothetical protein
LREIVQDECRPAGNDEGDKTGKQECTHRVFSDLSQSPRATEKTLKPEAQMLLFQYR